MSDARPTRRRFLVGTASLAATAAIAGCQAGQRVSLEPHLPASKVEKRGWRQVADIEDERSGAVPISGTTQRVNVRLKADVYEHGRSVRRLAERFDVEADDVELPAAAFVAAKARVDPPVTRLFALSDRFLTTAMDALEAQAKRELREQGFRDVRRVSNDRLAVEAGPKAPHRVYRAEYPYDAFEVSVEGQPVTVEAGVLPVEAQLAAWPYRGVVVTGAGVYPSESGQLTVTVGGTRREVSVDLEPERYRRDVRTLTQMVS